MEKEYTYSFIIPHKNCPDLLKRCVDSIPERDDVQIIVVDDNSDEGKTPSLPERKGMEIVLLDASQSKGAGRARNVGLKHAEGKWLLFPDSDDYYVEGFMDVLDGYKEKKVDVVYFNFEYRDGKTGELLEAPSIVNIINEFKKENIDYVKYRNNNPWSKMVLHEYVKAGHYSFEEVLNGNDILFAILVGYNTTKIIVEKKSLYVYVRNSNSIVTRKDNVETAMCRLNHRIKQNYFYKGINHSEWEMSIFKMILVKVRTIGIPLLISLIINSRNMFAGRKEWVSIIKGARINNQLSV